MSASDIPVTDEPVPTTPTAKKHPTIINMHPSKLTIHWQVTTDLYIILKQMFGWQMLLMPLTTYLVLDIYGILVIDIQTSKTRTKQVQRLAVARKRQIKF